MKALLLVAHGSRRQQSNNEVHQLANELRHRLPAYPIIGAAFLEIAQPSIPDAIKHCAVAGATEIVVLPYFLNAGRHVAEDIPQIIDDTQKLLPNVKVRLLDHIGASETMLSLLVDVISQQDT